MKDKGKFLHDARLALAGFLLNNDTPIDHVRKFGSLLAEATGNDVDDWMECVKSTATRIEKGEHVDDNLEKHLKEVAYRKFITWLGGATSRLSVNNFLAVMEEGQYIYLPTGKLWPAKMVDARIPSVDKQKASLWIATHRPVEQMTWSPGDPQVIEDHILLDGALVESPGNRIFNRYRGASVEVGDAKKAEPFVEHVNRIYPDDANPILDYLSYKAQHPGVKINHALFLDGDPGIGKDTVIDLLIDAFGNWNVSEVSPRHMTEPFNPWLRCVLLRVSEVRDTGDSNRYEFYEASKAFLATPPDYILCNEKNTKQYHVRNVFGTIYTSNYKSSGIYLPRNDRRHFVAWSNVSSGDFPSDYFTKLYGWHASGGNRHIAALLLERDVSKFDPKAPPPKTEAFYEIAATNASPEEADLADAIEEMGNPDCLTVNELVESITEEKALAKGDLPELAKWLRDKKHARQIPGRLEQVGYVAFRNSADTKRGRWTIWIDWRGRKVPKSYKASVYVKAELSTKKRFSAVEKRIG